jgi:mRNA interferase MazF
VVNEARRGLVGVNLPPRAGRHAAVLLSRDAAYRVRATITIAPVTPTIRNMPVEVVLDRSDSMPARCVVNLDDITTLPKVLIKQRITALSKEKIQQVDQAIRFALDLD